MKTRFSRNHVNYRPCDLPLIRILCLPDPVFCQQQHFRVRPQNISVGEGGTAVIPCEIGNRAGRVQWTKNGLTLGKMEFRTSVFELTYDLTK